MEENLTKPQLIQFVQRNISSAAAILRSKTLDVHKREFPPRYAFLSIKKAVDDFLVGKTGKRWIIMPGLRGTGKTTLLAQLYFHIKDIQKIPPEDIFYCSADEVVNLLKSNLYEIIGTLEELLGTKLEKLERSVFLLIDEAHYDENWAITLKSIYDKTQNVFVLTTGSSALALHTNPDVSRRAQIERVYPLRFIEYITLRYRIFPHRDLANHISDAIYLSPDAKTAYDRLNELRPLVTAYWAKVDSLEVRKYLAEGSLPFALGLSREDAYKRILEMMDNVIYKDLTLESNFKNETLSKFQGLLLLLASSDGISIQKIAEALGVNHQTVIDMLGALKRCELVDAVDISGNAERKVKKPPHYVFLAPMLRAAFLWNIGKFNHEPSIYGKLFEDIAVLYFLRAKHTKRIVDVSRRIGEEESDYLITAGDAKKIAFEFCMGLKGSHQAENTTTNTKAKYGVVIAENDLGIKGEIIFIPKQFFLLM